MKFELQAWEPSISGSFPCCWVSLGINVGSKFKGEVILEIEQDGLNLVIL